MIQLFEKGEDVNIEQFVTEYELQQVKAEISKGVLSLKEIFEGLEGGVSYEVIKICIALIQHRAVNL